jgi:hypothetical protein
VIIPFRYSDFVELEEQITGAVIYPLSHAAHLLIEEELFLWRTPHLN